MCIVKQYCVTISCLLGVCMFLSVNTNRDLMCSCCCAQIGSNGASSDDDVSVTQFAKGVRINILSERSGVVVGTICVMDAQPKIPPGWNDVNTKLGDYVSVSCNTAKPTSHAKKHVAEKENWGHYLRSDWTHFNKPDEDDDGVEDLDDDGGWEMTLQDIVDEGDDFLIYRELLSLTKPPSKKKTLPAVSTLATNLGSAARAKPNPRARDNSRAGTKPTRKPPTRR